MNTIGIIGLGKMGYSLLQGFLTTGIIKQEQALVFDLKKENMDKAINQWANINLGKSSRELANKADLLFIVVEPKDVYSVLLEIKDHLNPKTHVISLAACITINNISRVISSMVTKVIPAVLFRHGEGVSLISHGKTVTTEAAQKLEELFEGVSSIKVIEENDFEAVANYTSVGPALISSLCEEVVVTGLKHSDISKEEAENLLLLTIKGTIKMIEKENLSFSEVVDMVATRGGITEAGIKVFRKKIPPVMEEFFDITLNKHEEIKADLGKKFK